MKVSIMITCYNCEQYIDDAIQSVVCQELPFEWELLIGDDGSDDTTVAHVKKWMEKYPGNIKLFIMQRDGKQVKNGTRAARNRANLLKNAIGEYLIFLDGDDQFLGKEKIKKQVELLDNPTFSKCSCVAHNIVANDIQNGRRYPLTEQTLKDGIIDTRTYWKKMYFHTNTILFRKCCKELMLDERYCDYLNDNFITYIILQYGQIYYLHNLWAQYNLTGNGLWTGKKRTYGCFRNMILYDLEIRINKQLKKESFIRHLYDFRYLFQHYNSEDKEIIKPLIDGLNSEQFKFTTIMYLLDSELSEKQKKEKKKLKQRVDCVYWIHRVSCMPSKIGNVINSLADKICKKK